MRIIFILVFFAVLASVSYAGKGSMSKSGSGSPTWTGTGSTSGVDEKSGTGTDTETGTFTFTHSGTGSGTSKPSSTSKSSESTSKTSSKNSSKKSSKKSGKGSGPSPPVYHCIKDGIRYSGVFADPFNPCKVCMCCKPGIYTCTIRKCPKPKCGEKIQTLDSNGCCMKCPKICKKERKKCPKLNCPKRRYAYGETACCPSCGCVNFPSNAPQGKFGDECAKCECNPGGPLYNGDGVITCNRPPCPDNKLECVDPKFNKKCEYKCPQGPTCRRGDLIIKKGKPQLLGDKICVCERNFYPRAFCVTANPFERKIKKLIDHKCVVTIEEQKKKFHRCTGKAKEPGSGVSSAGKGSGKGKSSTSKTSKSPSKKSGKSSNKKSKSPSKKSGKSSNKKSKSPSKKSGKSSNKKSKSSSKKSGKSSNKKSESKSKKSGKSSNKKSSGKISGSKGSNKS